MQKIPIFDSDRACGLILTYCLQEEGIVVKAANSPWRCNDRGNAWLKIKPDYLQVSTLTKM